MSFTSSYEANQETKRARLLKRALRLRAMSVVEDYPFVTAQRADKLLRELLFGRVFALRMRGFARFFGRAELDMHYSLSKDLIPLKQFLATLREGGPQRVTTLMERRDY